MPGVMSCATRFAFATGLGRIAVARWQPLSGEDQVVHHRVDRGAVNGQAITIAEIEQHIRTHLRRMGARLGDIGHIGDVLDADLVEIVLEIQDPVLLEVFAEDESIRPGPARQLVIA